MIRAGDRVKLTEAAFDNGVFKRSKETRAYRGTVHHKGQRVPNTWAVKWDHLKTVQLLDKSFIAKATTGCRR